MPEKKKKEMWEKINSYKDKEIVRENKEKDKFECGLVRRFFFLINLFILREWEMR